MNAIYDRPESTPSTQQDLVEANRIYRSGDPGAIAAAEAIVRAHVAAQPTLMALDPTERQHSEQLIQQLLTETADLASQRQ